MQSPINTTKKTITYELMHMDKVVATVSALGQAIILDEQLVPYDIYLVESNDFEELLNNLENLYHWCASRVLSLDRTCAKQIMNILDYLVGNTDRHPENWGLLIDNTTNCPGSLYPLMDLNMSFQTYDKLDGANSQTVIPRKLTQRGAAIEAVQAISLRQIRDVDLAVSDGIEQEREMFLLQLAELNKYAKAN